MDAATRQLLATTAALLDMGRTIDRLSRPLTVLALAGLLAPLTVPVPMAGMATLVLAGLAGLGAAYTGARVAFDAALFRELATGRGDLALLDGALLQLGLLPAHKAGRPLADRLAGAPRLLLRHALLLIVQAAALLATGVIGAGLLPRPGW